MNFNQLNAILKRLTLTKIKIILAANHRYFFFTENLEKVKNYEELFCDIINICLQQFENKDYLTPEEKHMLVKVMGFCLFLIDSEQVNMNKLAQKGRLNFNKLDKIFHDLEVVPLFGDMQIAPFNYVKNSKHYDSSRWPLSAAASALPISGKNWEKITAIFFFKQTLLTLELRRVPIV